MRVLFADKEKHQAIILKLNEGQSERLENYQLMDGSLSLFQMLESEPEILWNVENGFNVYFEGLPSTLSRANNMKRKRKLRSVYDFDATAFLNVKQYI